MMKQLASLTFAALLVAAFGSFAHAQPNPTCDTDADGKLSCEEARCCFQQRIVQECNCETADNHGRFVSCAAHLIKSLEDEGMPRNCHGKLQRCAARSVCGKKKDENGQPVFHTCTNVEYGVCAPDATSGLLVCDTDGSSCATNTDCVASSRCKITRHGDECTEGGGALDLAPTCCSNCAAPPQ
jgi:hypothetical protein